MASAGISQPPPFLNEVREPDIPWKRWEGIFKSYLIAIGGSNFSNVRKQHILLHNLGIQGRKLYEDITGRTVDEETNEEESGVNVYEHTLWLLEGHFKEKLNVVLERHKFFNRAQRKDEKVASYVAVLLGMSATCEFGALTDSLIRDQLVRCTNDRKVQEELLTRNPDLAEAVSIAKGLEHTALCIKEMKASAGLTTQKGEAKDPGSEEVVCKVAEKSKEGSHTKADNCQCYRCGSPNHFANNWKCPARSVVCRKCNKRSLFKGL